MSTTEQARLLEKARVGQAPDCANVDSFTVPLFIEQNALKPLDAHFGRPRLADLLPYVRDVITGPDGDLYAWWFSTDLRVLYRRTDLVPKAPKDLGRADRVRLEGGVLAEAEELNRPTSSRSRCARGGSGARAARHSASPVRTESPFSGPGASSAGGC